MATTKIIVFGASGRVGSATARAVQQNGAKTFLALRNLQKPILGLSGEEEQEAGFERVEADLTDPESVQAAVTRTGAKRAFLYAVRGSPDHMRSTITALKSAGIEFVVFLSSFAIRGDTRSVPASEFIPFFHAQIEINLEEIFGAHGYLAVRPAYFANNSLRWKGMVRAGEVKIIYPDTKFDWISPRDIGNVCGTLLTAERPIIDGPDGPKNFVFLVGPEVMSLREGVGVIGRVIGKDIRVTELDEEQGLEVFVKEEGMAEPVARQLIKAFGAMAERKHYFFQDPDYDQIASNIEKYTGRRPTRFQEWVEENKQEFGA